MQITVSENKIAELSDLLKQVRKILIFTHQNPDGDAMGSALGLYNVLKFGGHFIDVMTPNRCPEFLEWLPGNSLVTVYDDNSVKADEIIAQSEIIFCVDFNTLPRIAKAEKSVRNSSSYKVLIDHHPNPEEFANFLMSDTSVSSTAELIFEFCQLVCPGGFNKNAAECLFTGIITDTGSFNHNSSTPRTYEIFAEILKQGINKDQLVSNIYDNYSESRMKMMGYCLNEKMKVLHEFNTAFISLTKEEMEEFHHERGDTEGFVNLPLSIKGIRFTALFTENMDHIRISFRSKGSFDVNRFSKAHFNGGGHTNAAGGRSYVSMNETIETFIKLLDQYALELK